MWPNNFSQCVWIMEIGKVQAVSVYKPTQFQGLPDIILPVCTMVTVFALGICNCMILVATNFLSQPPILVETSCFYSYYHVSIMLKWCGFKSKSHNPVHTIKLWSNCTTDFEKYSVYNKISLPYCNKCISPSKQTN